jgi:hypothetical protein
MKVIFFLDNPKTCACAALSLLIFIVICFIIGFANSHTESANLPKNVQRKAVILVLGGDTSHGVTENVEVIFGKNGTCGEFPNLPKSIEHHATIATPQRILSCGGRNKTGISTSSCWELNMLSDKGRTWKKAPSLPEPMYGGSLSTLGQERLH